MKRKDDHSPEWICEVLAILFFFFSMWIALAVEGRGW